MLGSRSLKYSLTTWAVDLWQLYTVQDMDDFNGLIAKDTLATMQMSICYRASDVRRFESHTGRRFLICIIVVLYNSCIILNH